MLNQSEYTEINRDQIDITCRITQVVSNRGLPVKYVAYIDNKWRYLHIASLNKAYLVGEEIKCENGPALSDDHGRLTFFHKDWKLHRIDGPAISLFDTYVIPVIEYWIDGVQMDLETYKLEAPKHFETPEDKRAYDKWLLDLERTKNDFTLIEPSQITKGFSRSNMVGFVEGQWRYLRWGRGGTLYTVDDEIKCENGPAVIISGIEIEGFRRETLHFKDWKLHCAFGPAIEIGNCVEYWLNGHDMDLDEYKLAAPLCIETDEEAQAYAAWHDTLN